MSACLAGSAAAEDCALVESRASLGQLSGAPITSVEVLSEGPELPGPARMFGALHVPSQAAVIRRQLLFAPGDTVDSVLVAESLRRLRAQRLFSDAVIQARRCDESGGVALSVSTHDTWTLRPMLRMRSSNQFSFGVEDRNFLGTGRAVTLTREMTLRGNGAAFSVADPFLFGTSLAGNLRLSNLAGGHTFKFGVQEHEYSVFDQWRSEGNVSRISYGDTLVGERALHTIDAMALFGRRYGDSPNYVTRALVGAEFDSAASVEPLHRMWNQPGTTHARSFIGMDLGLQRRTAQYDTASWIVPGRGFLDVPVGWEGEAVLGSGYERAAGSPALKVDAWTGRVWLPTHGQILMVDGWSSGYFGHNVDRNQITRAAASWYSAATSGMWGARVTAERLNELDPDRRSLSLMGLADYTAPVIRPYATRGTNSISASFERDMRVMAAGAASVINAGGFVAGSYRWGVDNLNQESLRAGVVGARFRLLSANGAISSTRVDIGYPVLSSSAVERKPFLIVAYGGLFDVSRQRDGRRVY